MMYVSMHIHAYIYIYKYSKHIDAYMLYICVYTCMHMCIYIHTYVSHTYIYTYIYIRMQIASAKKRLHFRVFSLGWVWELRIVRLPSLNTYTTEVSRLTIIKSKPNPQHWPRCKRFFIIWQVMTTDVVLFCFPFVQKTRVTSNWCLPQQYAFKS